MTKEINMRLDGGGTESMKFRACGSTAIRFKQLSGKDLMSLLQSFNDTRDGGKLEEFAGILGYVEYASANGLDMNTLTFNDYVAWLDRLESLEIENHAQDFVGLYMANTNTKSVAKNRASHPSGH